MRASAILFRYLVALLLGLSSVGCKQQTGTFVALNFKGTAPSGGSIRSIKVDLQLGGLGGRLASTTFQSPDGGYIKLPTDAILEIGNGAGALSVRATALADDTTSLAVATATGTVIAGQIVPIELKFGDAPSDGGTDGPSDAQPDVPVGGKEVGTDVAKDSFVASPDGADEGTSAKDVPGSGDTGSDGNGTGGAGTGGTGTGGSGAGESGAGGSSGDAGGTGGGNGTFQLTIPPATTDFGVVPVNTVSAPLTIVVKNTGAASTPPLTIFVGDGIHFPVYQDRCSGAQLASGTSCTIAFTFNPNAAGGVQTAGSVGPAAGPATTFTLSGTGSSGSATVTMSPSTVDFKTLDVGIGSSVNFTVTSNGTADPGMVKIQTSGSSAFHITNDTCSNISMGKLGMCTFTLNFTPTTVGLASTIVSATTASGSATSSSATGTGQDRVLLIVQFTGSGGGTVTGNGQTCSSGTTCSIGVVRTDLMNPPVINLSATANAASSFSGWSGICSGTGNCSVTMNISPQTVTTTFDGPSAVPLGLNVLGLSGQKGSLTSDDGTVTCSGSCPTLSHAATPTFTLRANPDPTSTFVGWTDGPCHGTSPTCTFPLNSATNVTATFGPQSYMFVSSGSYVPGQLGGVAGADNICEKLASTANLIGTYKAWLSTLGTNARTRVGNGGWVRTDGRPISKNIGMLTSTSGLQGVYYPPRLDELGNDLGNVHTYVATGGVSDGTAVESQCGDYTSPQGGIYVGDAAAGYLAWAYRELDSSGCNKPLHLYCFRSDALVADIIPPPQPGRRIFISSAPYVPGLGTSPDQMCQADATKANLANASKFIAFIATSTMPAAKRLSPGGMPWKRFDEVFVVRQPSDITTGLLLAPANLVADGSQFSNANIWSGTNSPTEASAGTCQDWQSNASSLSGSVGDSITTAAPDWFNIGTTVPCNNPSVRVTCIEP